MTGTAATSRSRRRRKEARPQELTAAALSLFVEKGFAATKLDEVAARAGVSKGTLYLYFDSKEALFKAVIQESVVPVIEAGEALLDEHDDPRVLLKAILSGWWERVGSTELGGVAKLMMSEAGNFPEVAAFYHEKVIQRGLGLVRAALDRGVARGLFRPVDAETVSRVLMAPLILMTLWRHSYDSCCARGVDTDQYLKGYFDLVHHGLAALTGEAGDAS